MADSKGQNVPNGGQPSQPNPSDDIVPKKEESFMDSKMFRLMTVGMYLCGVGDKIVIPELIAIQLLNSSTEVSAEEFYRKILYYHRQKLIEQHQEQKMKLWQLEQKQLQLNIMLYQQKFMNHSNFPKNILMHHHQQLLKTKLNITDGNKSNNYNINNAEKKNNQSNNKYKANNIEELNVNSLENWTVQEIKLDDNATHLFPILNDINSSYTDSSWYTIMPQLQQTNLNYTTKIPIQERQNLGIFDSNSKHGTFLKKNFEPMEETLRASNKTTSIARIRRHKKNLTKNKIYKLHYFSKENEHDNYNFHKKQLNFNNSNSNYVISKSSKNKLQKPATQLSKIRNNFQNLKFMENYDDEDFYKIAGSGNNPIEFNLTNI